MDKILDKIKKLLALATSSNPHEAALAAERAQELMIKHAIEEHQLADKPKDPIGTEAYGLKLRRNAPWRPILAHWLAPSFFCYSFYAPGSDIFFVGRQTDREVFRVTFDFLCNEIERLAEIGWARAKAGGTDTHSRRWKTSFYEGVIQIIAARLADNAQKFEKAAEAVKEAEQVAEEKGEELPEEQKALGEGVKQTAIVLASRLQEVRDYAKEHYKVKTTGKTRRVGIDGFTEGVRAGQKLDLSGRATKFIGENNG